MSFNNQRNRSHNASSNRASSPNNGGPDGRTGDGGGFRVSEGALRGTPGAYSPPYHHRHNSGGSGHTFPHAYVMPPRTGTGSTSTSPSPAAAAVGAPAAWGDHHGGGGGWGDNCDSGAGGAFSSRVEGGADGAWVPLPVPHTPSEASGAPGSFASGGATRGWTETHPQMDFRDMNRRQQHHASISSRTNGVGGGGELGNVDGFNALANADFVAVLQAITGAAGSNYPGAPQQPQQLSPPPPPQQQQRPQQPFNASAHHGGPTNNSNSGGSTQAPGNGTDDYIMIKPQVLQMLMQQSASLNTNSSNGNHTLTALLAALAGGGAGNGGGGGGSNPNSNLSSVAGFPSNNAASNHTGMQSQPPLVFSTGSQAPQSPSPSMPFPCSPATNPNGNNNSGGDGNIADRCYFGSAVSSAVGSALPSSSYVYSGLGMNMESHASNKRNHGTGHNGGTGSPVAPIHYDAAPKDRRRQPQHQMQQQQQTGWPGMGYPPANAPAPPPPWSGAHSNRHGSPHDTGSSRDYRTPPQMPYRPNSEGSASAIHSSLPPPPPPHAPAHVPTPQGALSTGVASRGAHPLPSAGAPSHPLRNNDKAQVDSHARDHLQRGTGETGGSGGPRHASSPAAATTTTATVTRRTSGSAAGTAPHAAGGATTTSDAKGKRASGGAAASANNGSHYTINSWYEGYVKRYNPLRGFGFLTGVFSLHFDVKQCEEDMCELAEISAAVLQRGDSDVEGVDGDEGGDAEGRTPKHYNLSSGTLPPHGESLSSKRAREGKEETPHDDATSHISTTPGNETLAKAGTAASSNGGLQHGSVVPSTMQWYLHKLAVKSDQAGVGKSTHGGQWMPRNTLVKVHEEQKLGDIFVHHSCISMDGFRVLPVNTPVRFSVSVLMNTVQAVDVVPLDAEFWSTCARLAIPGLLSVAKPGDTVGKEDDDTSQGLISKRIQNGSRVLPAFTISGTAEVVLTHHAAERSRLRQLALQEKEQHPTSGGGGGEEDASNTAGGASPVTQAARQEERREKSFWDDMAVVPSPAIPNSVEGQSELQAVQVVTPSTNAETKRAGKEAATERSSAGAQASTPSPQTVSVAAAAEMAAGKDASSGIGASTNDVGLTSTAGGMTSSKNNETTTGTGSGSENKTDKKTITTTTATAADENRSSENIGVDSSESRGVKGSHGGGTTTGDNNTTTGNEGTSSSGAEMARLPITQKRRTKQQQQDHAIHGGKVTLAADGAPLNTTHADAESHVRDEDSAQAAQAKEKKLLDTIAGGGPAAAAAAAGMPEEGGAAAALAQANKATKKMNKAASSEEEEYETRRPRGKVGHSSRKPEPEHADAEEASTASSEKSPTSGSSGVVAPQMDWTQIFDRKMEDERQKDILLHKGDYLKNFFPSQQLQQQQQQQQQQQERVHAKKVAAAAAAAVEANKNAAQNSTFRGGGSGGGAGAGPTLEIVPLSAVGELDSSSSRGVESQKNAHDDTSDKGYSNELNRSEDGAERRSSSSSVQDVDAAVAAEERHYHQHMKETAKAEKDASERAGAVNGKDVRYAHETDSDPLSDESNAVAKKSGSGLVSGGSENPTNSSGGPAGVLGSKESKGSSKPTTDDNTVPTLCSSGNNGQNSSSGPMPQTTATGGTGDDSRDNEDATTTTVTPTVTNSLPRSGADAEGNSGPSAQLSSESGESKHHRAEKKERGKRKEMAQLMKEEEKLTAAAAAGAAATTPSSPSPHDVDAHLSDVYFQDSDSPQVPMAAASSHLYTNTSATAPSGSEARNSLASPDAPQRSQDEAQSRGATGSGGSSANSGSGFNSSALVSNLMMVPTNLLPSSLAAQVPEGVGIIALPRSVVANLGIDTSQINPFLSAAQPMGMYRNEVHHPGSHRGGHRSAGGSGSHRSRVSSGPHQTSPASASGGRAPPAPPPQYPQGGLPPPPPPPLPPPAQLPAGTPPKQKTMDASNAFRQLTGAGAGLNDSVGYPGAHVYGTSQGHRSNSLGALGSPVFGAGYTSAASGSSASPGAGVLHRNPSHTLGPPPPATGRANSTGNSHSVASVRPFINYWSDDSSDNNGAYKAVFLFNPEQEMASLQPRSARMNNYPSSSSDGNGRGNGKGDGVRFPSNPNVLYAGNDAGFTSSPVPRVGATSSSVSGGSYNVSPGTVRSARPFSPDSAASGGSPPQPMEPFSTSALTLREQQRQQQTGTLNNSKVRSGNAAASPVGSIPGNGTRPPSGGAGIPSSSLSGAGSTTSSSSLTGYRNFTFPVPPRVPLESIHVPQPPWLRPPTNEGNDSAHNGDSP